MHRRIDRRTAQGFTNKFLRDVQAGAARLGGAGENFLPTLFRPNLTRFMDRMPPQKLRAKDFNLHAGRVKRLATANHAVVEIGFRAMADQNDNGALRMLSLVKQAVQFRAAGSGELIDEEDKWEGCFLLRSDSIYCSAKRSCHLMRYSPMIFGYHLVERFYLRASNQRNLERLAAEIEGSGRQALAEHALIYNLHRPLRQSIAEAAIYATAMTQWLQHNLEVKEGLDVLIPAEGGAFIGTIVEMPPKYGLDEFDGTSDRNGPSRRFLSPVTRPVIALRTYYPDDMLKPGQMQVAQTMRDWFDRHSKTIAMHPELQNGPRFPVWDYGDVNAALLALKPLLQGTWRTLKHWGIRAEVSLRDEAPARRPLSIRTLDLKREPEPEPANVSDIEPDPAVMEPAA